MENSDILLNCRIISSRKSRTHECVCVCVCLCASACVGRGDGDEEAECDSRKKLGKI